MAHPKLKTKRPRRRELKTIPVGETRSRLLKLSSLGVGRKAVHQVTGIDHRTLAKIKNGRTQYVRRETCDLIFSVPFNAHCDKALIDASQTWKMIKHMIEAEDMAFTQAEIARRLNLQPYRKCPNLNIGKVRVTARTARSIENLFRDALPCKPVIAKKKVKEIRDGGIDAGLLLLSTTVPRGIQLTLEEIAFVCGCSKQLIAYYQAKALRKLRRHASKLEVLRAISMNGSEHSFGVSTIYFAA